MKAIHQCVVAVMLLAGAMPGAAQRQGAAPSDVAISGELRQWHKVTLTLTGPQADEPSTAPNPFMDYRMTVTFAHESGTPTYRVPGYFAGDGDAANSSATSGNKWRAHLAPDKTGQMDVSDLVRVGQRRRAGRGVGGADDWRRSTAGRARSRWPRPTRSLPTFERAADCSTQASTICSSPAAVNTS